MANEEANFFDQIKINVKAGAGGNGAVSFRREKFVPFGGPDGGDGGRGGSVYLEADPTINTLAAFRYKRHFKAGKGGAGAGQKKHGKAGEDLVLKVPTGTQVRVVPERPESDQAEWPVLADLVQPGQRVEVARGGRGGLGNTHFATSTKQAPRVAQKGEPGEEHWLILELKLIADVGLVGYPNVGKSTLLASVTAAQPKIADYPFTTLSPNLGVVNLDENSFVLADIPGLIEGAHRGLGLGHDFLRHIERTRLLIHVLDGTALAPLDDYQKISEELARFDPRLAERPRLIAINKLDLPEVRERLPELRRVLAHTGWPIYALSAATGEGARELMGAAAQELRELRAQEPAAPVEPAAETKVYRPRPVSGDFTVEREDGLWVVRGRLAERAVAMTDLENPEGLKLLQRQLERLGVTAALEKLGVQKGDTVRFGKIELEWA